MATTTIPTLREQREAVVKAHIEAEAVTHDVAAALATFRHPRYEVPAVGAIADGPEAVHGLLSQLLGAFPDFWLHQLALYHADDAVIVEVKFGGTHRGVWAGIPPTETKWRSRARASSYSKATVWCVRRSILTTRPSCANWVRFPRT